MKPHIYLLRGTWTCSMSSGRWAVWPYGKGSTPREAFIDWARLLGTFSGTAPARAIQEP